MINLLITLLILCLICYLVNYIISQLPLPPPLQNVVMVVFGVLVLVYLIQLLLGIGPVHWRAVWWS